MSENIGISILGATGSIGRQTVNVVQDLPHVRVKALAAGSDYKGLAEIAKILKPDLVALYDENAASHLKDIMPDVPIAAGLEGILECVQLPEVHIVVNAMVGSIGLRPTLAAITAKKNIALANKETLVAAGSLVMESAWKNSVKILPIDSEHSAIWQCLQGSYYENKERESGNGSKSNNKESIKRLILTASGGPFREWELEAIAKAKASAALRHPIWSMGQKITIDSATMMNKGLEYIEAHHLFNIPYDKINVLIHPQSVIHSMVEFEDGAIIAQMGQPDMGLPIHYALTAPERVPRPHIPLDFLTLTGLTFEEPDLNKFPCLALAQYAAKTGGTLPTVMNTVNEEMVAAYLQGTIGFYDISRLIEEAFATYTVKPVNSLTDVEEAEMWAREFSRRIPN